MVNFTISITSRLFTLLYGAFAWGFSLLLFWKVWQGLHQGVARVQRLHQIPCANCQFFTGDYRLKCPVNPTIANSELAIDCPDYEPETIWA